MVISRTPMRISFFGGGTDYPRWYLEHGGAVLATTIDKYCYLTCRYLPPFFEHEIRLVYSLIENVHSVDDIRHPAVRNVLKFTGFNRGVEIHHVGDLPARSGMGSSSAFTVGLLHAVKALQGEMPSKKELADASIFIEQKMIQETVGSQDQMQAAFGGLNHISFQPNGEISLRPVTISRERTAELNSHLMLFFTGIKRTASNVADSYVAELGARKRQLRIMRDLVEEGLSILCNGKDIGAFGELLHEAWQAKRSLSNVVSNEKVDELYDLARHAGAVGGKLTGAGGGGFMLLFVPPERQAAVRAALGNLVYVPFNFEYSGTQIIFLDRQEDYISSELAKGCLQHVVFTELQSDQAAAEWH